MKKGMSLVELIISLFILFIILAVTFAIWMSVQRDFISQKLDREIYEYLNSAKTNILDSVLKSIFIYPPNVNIRLSDSSNFNLNINERIGYDKLLTITPASSGGYFLNVYLTRPRVPTDSAIPNARMLLYYRKFINWSPQYTTYTITVAFTGTSKTLKIGKITNYPTNITFTSGEFPKIIADYIVPNGFTVSYYVIDYSTLDPSNNTYSLTTYTDTIPSRNTNIQQVQVFLSIQRRYQNIVRTRDVTFNGTVFLEELPISY
ncbi:MAG: prepilin cleavage protein [Dictyoglomus turgidum]|nr:MAG: prepilin cleavage protein [Dictyoglomus turgidum]